LFGVTITKICATVYISERLVLIKFDVFVKYEVYCMLCDHDNSCTCYTM